LIGYLERGSEHRMTLHRKCNFCQNPLLKSSQRRKLDFIDFDKVILPMEFGMIALSKLPMANYPWIKGS
jgi:hypothetical protein